MRMNLNVELEFTKNIKDEKVIMQHVADALLRQIVEVGMVGDEEGYTCAFRVSDELDSIIYTVTADGGFRKI